jgi:hypothetical protein
MLGGEGVGWLKPGWKARVRFDCGLTGFMWLQEAPYGSQNVGAQTSLQWSPARPPPTLPALGRAPLLVGDRDARHPRRTQQVAPPPVARRLHRAAHARAQHARRRAGQAGQAADVAQPGRAGGVLQHAVAAHVDEQPVLAGGFRGGQREGSGRGRAGKVGSGACRAPPVPHLPQTLRHAPHQFPTSPTHLHLSHSTSQSPSYSASVPHASHTPARWRLRGSALTPGGSRWWDASTARRCCSSSGVWVVGRGGDGEAGRGGIEAGV